MTKLVISPEIFSKCMFYAWRVDTEIGGYGYIEIDKNEGEMYITDVFLTEQTVHNTECNLTSSGLMDKMEEIINSGKPELIEKITLWWHSHVNMGASHSVIDTTTMKEWPSNYIVSLVVNRKGELRAKIMTKMPVMIMSDLDVIVDWSDLPYAASLEEEVTKNVSEELVLPPQQYGYNTGGYVHIKDMTEKEWSAMMIEEYENELDEDFKQKQNSRWNRWK